MLATYTVPWLQQTLTMILTATVIAYACWAFDFAGDDVSLPLLGLSIMPVLASCSGRR